ncbi:N-acetylneuraminate synthase family protein [Candidatus Pelagibacter bacterium nBUS_49]|uniref:N-acetylneuraminate synthase family protein n=1 Tax=Candidatus Pelagibacter bacterium nBUS_49 TaxID=3374196 RepID=UPI003EBD7D37
MSKVYIIAEIGPNHNGNYKFASQLVEKLSKIGVNAVKFQLGDPRKSMSLDAFKADYQKINDNDNDIFKASKKRQLTHLEHKKIANKCKKLGVDYLCTPFDIDSLVFLDKEIDVPKFKIASGEIFSLDMLEYISNSGKSVIISTGMATFKEIKLALKILDKKNKDITILHCVSLYPAPLDKINLNVMLEIKKKFKTKVGYSDHTLGNSAAIAAVAMGASIVEKHVTLDRSLPGPDHKASATVEEFADLVNKIREVETVLGKKKKNLSKNEKNIAKVVRKSIVSKRKIKKNTKITNADICFRRPGTGIFPINKHLVIGKIAKIDIEKNRVIKKNIFYENCIYHRSKS